MVIYFSATGNTEFIAKRLAERLDDECINLIDRVKENDHSVLHSEKPFIVCAPIYVGEIPRFMTKYIKEQTFSGTKDVYCVFTSGGYCGCAGVLTEKLFEKKGMNYLGHADIQMPSNYTASKMFKSPTSDEIKNTITKACEMLDTVIEDIKAKRTPFCRKPMLLETWGTIPLNPVWSKFMYKAKDFYSTEKCICCGKCVKVCPLNNISLAEGKPVWSNSCTHCMACIGTCPTEAVEYGNITQDKEKYSIYKYNDFLKTLKDHE